MPAPVSFFPCVSKKITSYFFKRLVFSITQNMCFFCQLGRVAQHWVHRPVTKVAPICLQLIQGFNYDLKKYRSQVVVKISKVCPLISVTRPVLYTKFQPSTPG